MKLSEARKLWKHYVFLWKENAISGPGEWARELLKRDLKIDRLKTKLSEYTKLADIHEENQSLLIEELRQETNRLYGIGQDLVKEIEQLKTDCAPFQAQIDQAKTYTETEAIDH